MEAWQPEHAWACNAGFLGVDVPGSASRLESLLLYAESPPAIYFGDAILLGDAICAPPAVSAVPDHCECKT